MAIKIYGWCTVEGSPIPDLQKEYGSFVNLPSSTLIYYGAPEIQINNPTSNVNGCVYKVVPLSDFGYEKISDIDANYAAIVENIKTMDKSIDVNLDSQYYYEPFVVNESSIIFYEDSTKKTYSRYVIIYVDKYATPEIITVVGNYKGSSIPVGEKFNLDDLELFAVYSDGTQATLKEGYTVEPEDQIITKTGSNVIKITYTTPTGTSILTTLIIEGIKNLDSIEATYDGPPVAPGQEALKKYFIVVAKYTDGSSAIINDFTFPSGNIVSELHGIVVYYKGKTAEVQIPMYQVTSSRLIAYYNGPNIEIGHTFDIKYCNIKIYYKDDGEEHYNTYYEDISPDLCVFTPDMVDHEGVNHILVQYTGKLGVVSTTMIVIGIRPEVTLNFIEAEYTGPSIMQGKLYSLEKVICKAHYSDGTISVVRNFSVNSNVVSLIGLNEFVVTYKEKDTIVTTTISVNGLEPDATTGTNYSPIYLQNHYPEATRMNNRYRGPAEGYKHDNIDMMIRENILALYELFADIEQEFNKVSRAMNGANNIKVATLNTVNLIHDEVDKWVNDPRFTDGKYQLEEESNEQ